MVEDQVPERSASGTFDQHTYDVFISYSRRDAAFARQLQRALANYAPPRDLAVPQRRLRVFRDESDFQGTEYQAALDRTLQAAAKLVVICSPSSRSSPYVGGEIAKFATLRGKENIVTVLLAGIPNNEPSAIDEQRAFHDELVSRLPVPLASDYRGWEDKRDRIERDRFESGWYKLLADIYEGYGVDRSGIEQREKRRLQRTRRIRTALVSALTVVLASLTVWALISRQEAIAQRNTAQSRFLAAQSMSGAHAYHVSMLLAVAAQRTAPTFESWEALFRGLQRQPALDRFLYGVDSTVEEIFLGKSGTCAAAWTENGKTVVWTLASEERRFEVPRRAMPDHLCRSLFVSSADGGLERRPFDPAQKAVWSVRDAVDPPTAWVIDPGDTALALAYSGGRLVLREIADGRIRAELTTPGATWTYLQFSADGKSLAGIDKERLVYRWDATTLEPLSSPVHCEGSWMEKSALSRDLRWCAAGGPGHLGVTDLNADAPKQRSLGTPWILALEFSPDGRTLMAGVQGGNLQFWRMEDLQRDAARPTPAAWSEHRSDVTAAAYTIDGGIISAARDRSVAVWQSNPSSRFVSRIAQTAEKNSVAVDVDAQRIAIGTTTGDLFISSLEPEKIAAAVPLVNLGKAVTALALTRSGEILAGTEQGEVIGVTAQSARRSFKTGQAKPIVRIRLNQDESRASAITENGVATVWDVRTGAPLATFAGGKPRSGGRGGLSDQVDAVFEPGGTRVVSIHGGQQAFLWDWNEGQPHFSPLPFRPTSYFTTAAFAADRKAIALGTGIYEGEIVLFDPSNTGASPTRLQAHELMDVTALAFSPDVRLLFSAGFDGRIAVWDVAGRRQIGEAYRGDRVTELGFTPSGTAVTAITKSGAVLKWDLEVEHWLEKACRIANRELSAEERARFMDGAGVEAVCRRPGGS